MNPFEFQTLSRAELELWWFRGMRDILFRLLDPIKRLKRHSLVLDAGSGTGYMARILSERYGWRVVATDIAREGVSALPKHSRMPTVQASIAACPFQDATFDAVVSLDVLVHFERGTETAAIQEFARIVKPGGMLLLRVSALDILRSRHSEFTSEKQRYTRRRLVKAAEAAGFRVLRATYANALLLPIALLRFRIWEPLLRRPASSGTAPVAPWLNRLLGFPLRIEAALLARGWNFPAGQSLILIAVRDETPAS